MSPEEANGKELVSEWLALVNARGCSPATGYAILGDLIDSALSDVRSALAASAAKVEQYERESADENTCAAHPKTMLVYHCAACADALTAKLEDFERLKRAVNSSADCLPACDGYAHAENCPSVNTAQWLIDLTAKLQASERDRESDRQSLMEVLKRLQESEEARGASERALERAKADIADLHLRLRALLPPSVVIASPEARATGETGE